MVKLILVTTEGWIDRFGPISIFLAPPNPKKREDFFITTLQGKLLPLHPRVERRGGDGGVREGGGRGHHACRLLLPGLQILALAGYILIMVMAMATPTLDDCQPNHFQTTWQNESGTGHSTGLKVLRQSCIPVYR